MLTRSTGIGASAAVSIFRAAATTNTARAPASIPVTALFTSQPIGSTAVSPLSHHRSRSSYIHINRRIMSSASGPPGAAASATAGGEAKATGPSDASRLSRPLPRETWDSHMHVVEPDRFPLSPTAKYTPHAHTLADARSFYNPLGVQNLVLVQPSIYGTDNECMLEALRELTPAHGRAVVELDPKSTTTDTLEKWHAIGVRGVRVNLVSVGRSLTEPELRAELQDYASLIRPFGWVLQVYIPLTLATALESIVPDLKVKFCIDHFGSPPLTKPYDPETSSVLDPYDVAGFSSLINLLKAGSTWIKMSAPYRLSTDPELRDLDPFGRELIRQAPDRVVYATDWPHTRFDNIDSIPFIERCYDWCGGDDALIEKLFRTNAEELWDVASS